VIAGAFAGSIGKLLINERLFFRVFTGIILIILGLMVMEVIPHFSPAFGLDIKVSGFFSSFALGFLFAINMTPCIGPLFGSALVMASKEGSILKGMILLLIYGVGMVIPFLLVALLADYVRKTFEHLDNVMNYLKYVFGAIIIITGILVIAGVI
jgi:cytochrome c-type biogenesis protein